MFRKTLQAAGIVVHGSNTRRGSLGASGKLVAAASSAPLSTTIGRINVPSDNFAAEMLLKVLGARFGDAGSTTAGVQVARATLADIGVEATMVDGSGLSRSDRVAPRELVTLLDELAQREEGPALRASLATAGRTGTLEDRMERTPAQDDCVAKTGTLRGVSALSGYCNTAGGDVVAFSFIENGVCEYCATDVEDRMVAAIARYGPSASS